MKLKSTFLKKKCVLIAVATLFSGGLLQLKAENNPSSSPQMTNQATRTIKGKVMEENGDPLIGVSVSVDKTTTAVMTDLEGNYQIKLPSGNTKLKFVYVGYKEQVVDVGSKTIQNIVLQEDNKVLDEVVVVGYGTQKKATLSGSVATVNSESFQQKGNLSSPLQALQGQVPGVMITRSSTAPGDESWSMSLRGAVSANSTEPLIIIDGVAYNSVNDLRLLNPNDIESINFLKDGAAAIYGSRAAGGVVLITTKQGKQGKTKVEYSGTMQTSKIGLMPHLMNIDQWADGIMTTLENDDNTSSVWYTYAQLAKKYKGKYIDLSNSASPFGSAAFTDVADFVFSNDDWLGNLFGNSYSTEHNLSISGGGENTSYRLSLGYLYNGSTLQYGDNNNKRYTFRLNNNLKLSKHLSLESSISYNRQEQVAPTMVSSALTSSVPMPGLPLHALNGKPYAWGTWYSPVAEVEDGGDNKLSVSYIGFSETFKYNVTNWLDANVNLGYNTSNAARNINYNSIDYYNYAGTKIVATIPTVENSYYEETNAKTDFYSIAGYLQAKKTYSKTHNFSLMLGSQYEFKDYTYYGVIVKDPQTGLEIVNGSGDVTLTGDESRYQNANLSYFSRFNYDYRQKYLLEFNARYDGSSKFLSENRWKLFWGTSLGWRLTEEKFMKGLKWLNDLKLRASYAIVGNQSGIGNYDGVQLYSVNSSTGAYVGDSKLSYITTSGTLASTSRTWEQIENYNIGIDFGLLNQRLTGTIDVFLKKNNNMLISVTYPGVLGITAPSSNSGKFKDSGFEGKINWHDKIGNVAYDLGGSLSFARNKLVYYGGTTVKSSGYTSSQQGYPLSSIFGLRYGGKIQNENQLEAYEAKYYTNNGVGMPSDLRVGDNMYCDLNNDGVLDYNDYEYLGSDTPEISYSFNLGANWKGFSLSCIFQGVANRFVYRGNTDTWVVPFRAIYTNTTTQSIGHTWSEDNPNAYYAPYTTQSDINTYNYQASSLTAQDGRYIRLKNVTLGYTLPSAVVSKMKFVSNVHFYLTGADIWEYTKIKDGWDPEAKYSPSGTQRYPFTRNYTFGLDLTF